MSRSQLYTLYLLFSATIALLFIPLTLLIKIEQWYLAPLLLLPILLRTILFLRPLPHTPYTIALPYLILMGGLSLVITPDLANSFAKVVGLWSGLLLFVVVVDAVRFRHDLFWGLLLAFITVALFLIVVGTVAGYPPLAVRLPMLGSLNVNPNQVAGIITWSGPLTLLMGLIVAKSPLTLSPIWRFLGAISLSLLFLLQMGILARSGSRSGLVGIAIASCTMALLLVWRNKQVRLMAIATLIFLAGIGLAAYYLWDRSTGLASADNAVYTLSGRVEIWSRAIFALQDFPFTGMGMNSFRKIVHLLYPFFSVSSEIDIAHAHNMWLQIGLDLGLPALIAYLSVWFGSFFALTHPLKSDHAPTRWAAIGLVGSFVAHTLYGLTDAIALGSKVGFLQWWIFGLVVGLASYSAEQKGSIHSAE